MIGDFFTKPLQGKLFRKFLALILNLSGDELEATFGPSSRASTSQECVDRDQRGTSSVELGRDKIGSVSVEDAEGADGESHKSTNLT